MICVVKHYTCHDDRWLRNINPISSTAMEITIVINHNSDEGMLPKKE